MSLIRIIMLAFGLAADAFAVSLAEGVTIRKGIHRHTLRISILFGLSQGIMPVLGWLMGRNIRSYIQPWDHWVVFGVLGFIGGKMITDALFGVETGERPGGASGSMRLFFLAVATSVDALAIGITVAMLGVDIWAPAVIIGLITTFLCAGGVQLGYRAGNRWGRPAEILGGIILVGLGVKILFEHLLG
ncbi:MAG: manganese efflux pump MntP family protein [Candidatus Brocadiia bacterium]